MIVAFVAVFAAGVLTVLSPCVLPLAPILVGGLVATGDATRWARLRATAWFALGFAVVFAVLGLGVSSIVTVVRPLRPALLAVAAATIGLYGLKMMGLLGTSRLGWMERSVGPATAPSTGADRPRAVLLGAVFGLTWTPCAGPILGGVLTYVAARAENAVLGVPMLLTYAAGVATPLLIVAAAAEYVTPMFRRLGAHLETIERASGAALVALGVLVLFQIPSGGGTSPLPTAALPAAERPDVARLVFFHSEHCPMCRAMEEYLPALERACPSDGWTLTKIDVDRPESAPAVEDANVRAVPTVSLRDERGREVRRLVGYQSEARLREVLEGDVRVACAAAVAPVDPAVVDGPTCDVGKAC